VLCAAWWLNAHFCCGGVIPLGCFTKVLHKPHRFLIYPLLINKSFWFGECSLPRAYVLTADVIYDRHMAGSVCVYVTAVICDHYYYWISCPRVFVVVLVIYDHYYYYRTWSTRVCFGLCALWSPHGWGHMCICDSCDLWSLLLLNIFAHVCLLLYLWSLLLLDIFATWVCFGLCALCSLQFWACMWVLTGDLRAEHVLCNGGAIPLGCFTKVLHTLYSFLI